MKTPRDMGLEPGEKPCECPFHSGAKFFGRMGPSSPNQEWKVESEIYYADRAGGTKGHYLSLRSPNISHSYVVRCISVYSPKPVGKAVI